MNLDPKEVMQVTLTLNSKFMMKSTEKRVNRCSR